MRSERWLGRTKFRPIDYMRTLVNDEGFFNQSAMEQLLGVHAVLRSKNGLTPSTLLEMDEMFGWISRGVEGHLVHKG